MTRAKQYLQDKSVISNGDIVFIGLKELMDYTKLVQLEAMLVFVQDNLPEAYGIINDINFKIREIVSQKIEDNNNPFDE